MKCTIPEISWHNREPVLSVDIHPISTNFYKVATGGGDCHVLIWQMNITDNGAVKQEVISDLKRHQRAVNCVRWSPTGQYLASGDDDANIIIWQLKTDSIPLLEGDTEDKEVWIVYKVLRGHKEDVYDLCWSVDESKLLSGSVDNTAIVWDVTKGKLDHILCEHKGFVQGVAWDPKNEIIATLSTDRVCRIFDTTGKQVKARISKGVLQVPKEHFLYEKEVKYFHDDTFKSFFRRLQFSPDGSLLIVPSGHIEGENCKVLNATLIFTLESFNAPAAVLPLKKQSSTVVRCCPLLFELHDYGPEPLINLPYRIIFAVGTDHDVLLYDTQQMLPFARFQDIHYTRLTDLTWSSDGLLLVASSTDGFCCLITFDVNELGVPYTKNVEENVEESVLNISGCEELEKDENVDTNNKEATTIEARKRPSFLQQWTLKTPTNKKRKTENGTVDAGDCIIVEEKEEMKKEIRNGKKSVDVKKEEIVNVLIPRSKREVTDGTTKNHSAKPTAGESIDIQKEDDIKIEETVEIKNVIEIKKRSTFLEQWALKSSTKKTKLGEESNTKVKKDVKEAVKEDVKEVSNGKDDNADVIILDSPEKKPEELKEISEEYDDVTDEEKIKIRKEISNILCQPKQLEIQKKDHMDAKPIAVRRKPRILVEDASQKEISCTNEGNASSITQKLKVNAADVIILDSPKKKPEQFKENSEEYDDVTDEEKIKIRKEISNILCQPKQLDIQKKVHMDAKPIEVRRKPRILVENASQKEISCKNEENTATQLLTPLSKSLIRKENCNSKDHENKKTVNIENKKNPDEIKVKLMGSHSVKEDCQKVKVNASSSTQEPKVDPVDVIILDSPENNDEELKEHPEEYGDVTDEEKIKIRKEISEIWSRPTRSKNQKNDHSDAKPIAVRRKPRLDVENTVTIEKNDAGKVEALSLVKNEEEISKSFKNTIEKSKKTKEKSENAIEQQKKRPVNFLQQWVKSSTPKKIKTDTEEEEIKTKVDINVVEIGNTLQKGQELIVPKQQTPKKGNKIETKTKDKETSVVEKKITATTSKRKKAETDTNVKESPKQQTKIKVTSLTKKKTEEKKRLATPFCKIEKKSRLKSKLLGNTTFPTIDLSIEEACDSWKNVEKDDKHEDSAKKIDVTDDCTEDFTLQLEESQTSNIENCAKHGHIEEDKRRNCDISLSAEDSVVIEKNGSNKDSKSCDNNVATCSLDSGQKSCSGVKTSCSKDVDDSVATCVNSEKKDDCSKTETEKRDNLKHKLPRRVQLITISSPEGKKRAK